jgi:hypothetical protein
MPHVKTAISLDESLFEEAEAWAGKLGISRSELYSRAVADFVRQRENEELLEKLNESHAEGPDEDHKEALKHGQALFLRMLEKEEREGRR